MAKIDFAAAHHRVLERRKARDTAAAQRRAAQTSIDPSSPLARLPSSAQTALANARLQWNAIRGRQGTNPAFRVGQVDAELLDEELLELLKGQVGEALKYFGPYLREDWSSEITLALRALLFKLSVWDNDASYGAAMQNLRYSDARGIGSVPLSPQKWQKALLGLLSVGGRYAWEKWETYLLDVTGGYDEPAPHMKRLASLSSILSTTHTFAATASFLVFLVNGRYRTLLDRILRLRLTPTTAQVSREVSFEYLNRQLVWHAFTEFLLFLLPLVGISRWRKWVAKAWRHVVSAWRQARGKTPLETAERGGDRELHFLPERTCAICYKDQNPAASGANGELANMAGAGGGVVGSAQTDITNPYEAIPCGDVYCYTCIAQRLEAEDGDAWTCLRCGEDVTECRPWTGDVLEEKSRSSSGKSVSFADEHDNSHDKVAQLEPMPMMDEKLKEVEQSYDESAESSFVENGAWAGLDEHHDAAEGEGLLASASLIEAGDDEDEQGAIG